MAFNRNRNDLSQIYQDSANNRIGIRSKDPSEALEIGSTDTTNGTGRLKLSTYEETSGGHNNEVLRIQSMNEKAKPAIAFLDVNGDTQTWLQQHDYLHYYAPRTFTAGEVNSSTDVVTLASSGYPTGWKVSLASNGTLPAGLGAGPYYINVSGSSIKFYDTSANALAGGATGLVDITDGGSGTHTLTPDNLYANNRHQHFGIEVSDASGSKQTRLSIPYGFDTCEMGVFNSNLNVNNGKLRINGDSTSFKELQFGNTLSNNLTPDLTTLRWTFRQDNTTESGSNVGSDFRIISYDDAGATPNTRLFLKRSNGFVGFGTNSPSNLISLAPGSIRKIAIEPSTTGTGDRLSVESGSALSGGTNLNGGELRMTAGNATGSGTSFVTFYTATAGSSGTTTRTSAEKARIDGNGNLGVNTTSPHSKLHVNGAMAVAFVSKTAAYTATSSDNVIAGNATSGAFTVTLPTAVGIAGRMYTVKKVDASANAVTVGTTSSQTIDGVTTKALSAQWNSVTVISDGANWLVI